ncbi:putative F-box/FBD/LRR-repeat protein At1g78760 [Phragmites australis]|uniref:putative F-box/FBD/LRR-repeat protein At1g78760 n=1 Tax=Phragmites australis TaxID=29695 RepID=UPI002D7714F8|nr:putative F-box/FBD/LRR-repeat protein At1g78760 [Phragmites australis]
MAEVSGSRRPRMAPASVPGAACRINTLPRDLLLRAISHLNARELVQTCVLSRQWRHLWRSVPRINATIDEFDDFDGIYNFYDMADRAKECSALFKKFVNRFLMLRNPVPLDEFRLTYYNPDGSMNRSADSEEANLWIRHALLCNARSVEVTIQYYSLLLDPAVFTSECFLTRLLLSSVLLPPGFFRQLQTGCKALERLILRDCDIDDVEISSETLKVLTIDDTCCITFEEQASISIPSLLYLGFFPDARIPLLKNMESLETACVSDDTQVDDIYKSLSGVTDLDINYEERKLKMERKLRWCPKLNNLTTLTFSSGVCIHICIH